MDDAESARREAATLPSELRRLLADYWRGVIGPKALVEWATEQLVAGRDSSNLRVLAGLTGNDREETEHYFHRSLKELGVSQQPSREECLFQYCGDVARQVLNGSVPVLPAFEPLWSIAVELNYPPVLRCVSNLEVDLDVLDYHQESAERKEAAVRDACARFLPILEGYTESGVARLTIHQSLDRLRRDGWEVPKSAEHLPKERPSADDESDGYRFFRTLARNEDFRDLTMPRTLFLRSEIDSCKFENADLSESSMTWCDWNNCSFTRADLHGCDLRRAVFKNCEFFDAILDRADLRGTQFIDCRLTYASMKGAILEKAFGLFSALRCSELKLSKDQERQIHWVTSAGKQPPGG